MEKSAETIEVYEWSEDGRSLYETITHLNVPPLGLVPQVGDVIHFPHPSGSEKWPYRWRVVDRELLWSSDGRFLKMWIQVKRVATDDYERRSHLDAITTST